MTNTQSVPSVVDRIKPSRRARRSFPCILSPAGRSFALGEETLLFVAPDGAEQRVRFTPAAFLAVACDGARIATGGDDGKVVATTRKGRKRDRRDDAKHRWIDRVAIAPDGAIAWAAGKQAFVRTAKGEVKSVDLPSSIGGLAFAPKGLRLAIAHYGGVSLWFPNAQAAPRNARLEGLASRRRVQPGRQVPGHQHAGGDAAWLAPDGRQGHAHVGLFREGTLDGVHGGRQVARHRGLRQLILWPFGSKDGPMGKQPRMVLPHDSRVVAVACHPLQEIVAAGFEDGMVMLARIEDGAEIPGEEAGQRGRVGARVERRGREARVRNRGRRGGGCRSRLKPQTKWPGNSPAIVSPSYGRLRSRIAAAADSR
jgi:hypothetical protein